MKTLLLCSLLAASAAFVYAADTPSITGKWQVHISVSGNDSDQVCTFTQKDDALSGTCTSERGTFELNGNITGNKVKWSYKSEYEGTPLTVKFEGALDSESRMKGSVDVPEFGASGDFSATQSKEERGQ